MIRTRFVAFVVGLWVVLGGGCTNTDLFVNLTSERAGNFTAQFVNSTRFRASFTFGTWDSFDRVPPGAADVQQLRVEGQTASAPVTLQCRRNLAIGTGELIERALDNDFDDSANFDADAFNMVVNFSSAPLGSDAEALPTAGTADGRELLLGVDYTCADLVIFTFVDDPDAPGGFRIDFSVLIDAEDS